MTEQEKDQCLIDMREALNYSLEGPEDKWGIDLEKLAARLAELGYVRVVRCGECKLQHSPYCYHEGFDDKDYCPEGERVVAKSATGEEAGK